MADTSLPPIDFPVPLTDVRPTRQSADDSPAIIVEATATEHVPFRELELSFSNMTAADLALLQAAWDEGRGACTPFEFTVPGEGSSCWWVFRDAALQIDFQNASSSNATIVLRDVTIQS